MMLRLLCYIISLLLLITSVAIWLHGNSLRSKLRTAQAARLADYRQRVSEAAQQTQERIDRLESAIASYDDALEDYDAEKFQLRAELARGDLEALRQKDAGLAAQIVSTRRALGMMTAEELAEQQRAEDAEADAPQPDDAAGEP